MSFSLLSLLLWLAAAPLLLFPGLSPPATATAVAGLLALRLYDRARHGRFVPPTYLDSFITLYLFFNTIAFLISPVPDESLRRLLLLLWGVFGYYALVAWIKTAGQVRYVLLSLAGVGAAVAGISFFSMQWPARHIVNLDGVISRLPHLSGDFTIHYNQLASIMLVLLPLTFYLWQREPNRWARVALTLAGLLMLAALFLTQSRNAWSGLLVALAAWYGWSHFRFRYALPALFVWLAVPFLVSLTPLASSPTVIEGLARADISSKPGPEAPRSWPARLEIWAVAGQLLRDYPVMGAGLYAFEPVSRANYVYRVVEPTFRMTHAHNLLLQTGASLGWGGALLLAGLWTAVLYQLWQAGGVATSPLPTATRPIAAILGATFTGYLWFNLFDVFSLEQRPGMLIWLLLALSAVILRDAPAPRPALHAIPPAVLALFAVLCLTPALPRNWAYGQLDRVRFAVAPPETAAAARPYLSRRRLAVYLYLQGEGESHFATPWWQSDPDAVLFLRTQAIQAFINNRFEEASDWFAAVLALNPQDGATYFWRGEMYRVLNRFDLATADYARAIQYSQADDPAVTALVAQAWASQGWIFARQGEWQPAVHAYNQAVYLMPDELFYRQALEGVQQAAHR